jgi:hypothetical protein
MQVAIECSLYGKIWSDIGNCVREAVAGVVSVSTPKTDLDFQAEVEISPRECVQVAR